MSKKLHLRAQPGIISKRLTQRKVLKMGRIVLKTGQFVPIQVFIL
jgi:hypothetical protein